MGRKNKYSKRELISALKGLSKKTGKKPTYIEVEADPNIPSVYMFKKEFGTWTSAMKAAGFEVFNEHRSYTRKELIDAIHRFKIERGRVPTEKLMNQTRGFPSGSVYNKEFGSWKDALKEAGFDVNKIYSSPSMDKIKRYENETLLKYLREYNEIFDEIPVPINWFRMKDSPRREIYIRRFGSWKNALREAGFESDKIEDLTL